MVKKYMIWVLSFILNHIPQWLWSLLDVLVDVVGFWLRQAVSIVRRRDICASVRENMKYATTYEEWEANAVLLDKLTGGDKWRRNFTSRRYDYNLILERLKMLREARMNADIYKLLSLFSSGLVRNFGSISNKDLYMRAYSGTKTLIEDYISELLVCLNYLSEWPISKTTVGASQVKFDFFHDAKQSFGSTALILQGGSLFGLCHLGVIKALYTKGLLPRIICGSSAGAVVAALICAHRDDELSDLFENISRDVIQIKMEDITENNDKRYGSIFYNVLTNGYAPDIMIFMEYVKKKIGNMTFEEAYLRSEKVLNIIIHPTRKSVPSSLNYLTAPNMVIWSAIYASIGEGIMKEGIELYVKDLEGKIVRRDELDEPWNGDDGEEKGYGKVQFMSPHQAKTKYLFDDENPYKKMSELFNVNHFVISLARPYLAPFFSTNRKHREGVSTSQFFKLKRLIQSVILLELQHRLWQADKLGLVPSFFRRFIVDEKLPYEGTSNNYEITIVPEVFTLIRDIDRIFDIHRMSENISYWILVGERSVWPLLPLLWSRCGVEFALDDFYDDHSGKKRRRK